MMRDYGNDEIVLAWLMLKMKAKRTVFSDSRGGIYCVGRHVPQSHPQNVYIQNRADMMAGVFKQQL